MIQSWLRRYGRRRRLIAAALAGLAVMTAFLATRPATAPPVLVSTRDLSPGPIRPGDFAAISLNHPPAGALRTAPTGQTLATPMRRGEPLTDARLLTSYPLPPGLVATPVRIADAAAAALLTPGTTISLLAPSAEGTAHYVASDITVLTIPTSTARGGTTGSGALIVLATTSTQAAALAAAQTHDRPLSITIKTNRQ
ncbi:SAF domain-containing protein [Nonomuraea sp. NPDC050643]|uniref:SAF domain-containing protein n=1 Tax=Nonomuraea sp. NPDC050643 TaxID=3155660 RepID=UPI0033EDCF64